MALILENKQAAPAQGSNSKPAQAPALTPQQQSLADYKKYVAAQQAARDKDPNGNGANQAFGDSAIRSATFGLGDKALAAIAAGAQPLTHAMRSVLPDSVNQGIDWVGNHAGDAKPLVDASNDDSPTFKQRYQNILDKENVDETAERNAHPVASGLGEAGGTAAAMLGTEGLAAPLADTAAVNRLRTLVQNPIIQKLAGSVIKGVGGVAENTAVNAAEEAGQNKNANVSIGEAATRGGIAGAQQSAPGIATAAGGPVAGGVAAEAQGLLPGPIGRLVRALTAGAGGAAVGGDTHQDDVSPDNSQNPDASNGIVANPIDVDALLNHLGIDPDSPHGTQIADSLNPSTDDTDDNTQDGQPVSADVPQVTKQNGKTVFQSATGKPVTLN